MAAFSMPPCQPDVLVIGGGSAGVAAGIAAARRGAEVLLVEAGGCLGGAGTAALVHSFCGLYELRENESQPLKTANAGLPDELQNRLRAEGIATPRRMGRVDVLMHSPQRLAAFYDRWCAAESRLQVLLHTSVVAAETGDGRVGGLTLHCRGSSLRVQPRTVVDASGDAVLAALTGHAFELAPTRELLRPAYCVGIAGAATVQPLELAAAIVGGIQGGHLPGEAAGAQFRQIENGQVFMTIDLPGDATHLDYDSTSASSLSAVEISGRTLAFQVIDFLRGGHAAFREAWIAALPARAGVRESRRWAGRAVLTEEDLLSSRRTADEAALATWPMELRETAKGPKLIFPREATPCGIPAGCMQARDLANVFIAGRCLSTTHRAQASTRVMGTALATGEAAGKMAASSA
jgi:hypothetical protein